MYLILYYMFILYCLFVSHNILVTPILQMSKLRLGEV